MAEKAAKERRITIALIQLCNYKYINIIHALPPPPPAKQKKTDTSKHARRPLEAKFFKPYTFTFKREEARQKSI